MGSECFHCGKDTSGDDHFCEGCRHYICDECSVNYNMPFGSHDVGLHLEEPDEGTD